ncbi:MAG: hypothetical protein IK148_10235 [Prevotella sp.]|nr:hypothetical protein [Prevotella sp.]
MKQKNCFWAVAASMLLAAASFTSCSNQDSIIAPEEPVVGPDDFDEGSLVVNGNCEGTDASCFVVHEWRDGVQYSGPAKLKWDEVTPKNHCAVVVVRSEEEARAEGNATLNDNNEFMPWDSQFFITFGADQALNEGDKFRVTMRVRADEPQNGIGTQMHKAPGEYLHWQAIGNVNFTEDWEEFDSGWQTASPGAWGSVIGGYTVAFNLATGNHNRFFFDDIRVEVQRYIPDPEPTLIDGYQIVFWNWGVAKEDQLSVKYFKNYVAPTAEDGAIVVQALEPGKNYNDQYWMADGNGNQIDAVLTNDWDTQFLIGLPKPLAKGTKGKLVMKVKADKATKAGTQCHTAIPIPGAIEGKDGYAGTYMHWAFMGDISFTEEWQTITADFTVPDQGDGVQSICLNLEGLREPIKYYFDDITVYIEKDWEPEAEAGWDIVTWSTGKDGADATKFQVKYFKNYVAAKSSDGAVVVESLDPTKTYTQYYMADGSGNQVDAILANDWDTQFLIGLPAPYAKGTKFKVSMMIKADKAANTNTQTHSILPAVGAIEGKDGYAGTYKHWALMGDVAFTTEWKQINQEFTTDNDAQDGMGSICFNLDVLREVNKYYFKNIVVRVAK